jgi:hypothetical protein
LAPPCTWPSARGGVVNCKLFPAQRQDCRSFLTCAKSGRGPKSEMLWLIGAMTPVPFGSISKIMALSPSHTTQKNLHTPWPKQNDRGVLRHKNLPQATRHPAPFRSLKREQENCYTLP